MSEEAALLEAVRAPASVPLEAFPGLLAWLTGIGLAPAGPGRVDLGGLAAAGVAGMIALDDAPTAGLGWVMVAMPPRRHAAPAATG